MLVFDRLSLFPLTLVLLSCSPLYSLPFHLIHCILLSSLVYVLLSMLDAHACFISFTALPDRPLQSTMEPRSRSPQEATTTTSSTRLTRSSFGGSQGGGLAFSICISDDICASLL